MRALGERETDKEGLERAVAAYRAALEVRPRDRVPFSWAITQKELGITLQKLGEWTSSKEQLQIALTAAEHAFEVLVEEAGQLHHKPTLEDQIRILKLKIEHFDTELESEIIEL